MSELKSIYDSSQRLCDRALADMDIAHMSGLLILLEGAASLFRTHGVAAKTLYGSTTIEARVCISRLRQAADKIEAGLPQPWPEIAQPVIRMLEAAE